MSIAQKHLEEWCKGSGIALEIAELNLRSLEPREANKILRRKDIVCSGWWAEGVEPLTGGATGHGQFKPDEAHLDDEGKPMKYITPRGNKSDAIHLAMADESYWRRAIAAKFVVITEGAKKAAALLSVGLPAVALTGVWNGTRKETEHTELVPMLEHWIGAKILLCFDADQKSNAQVRAGLQRLAATLTAKGCEVENVTWDVRLGKGIDDVLTSKGEAKVREIMQKPRKFEVIEGGKKSKGESKVKQVRDWMLERESEFSYNELLMLPMRYGEPVRENDEFQDLVYEVASSFDFDVQNNVIMEALVWVAKRNRYHPIREYVDGIRKRFPTEDREIFSVLAHRLVDQPTELQIEMMHNFFMQVVNRIYNPGCEAQATLTLVGKGGRGKSSFALKVALQKEWFTDSAAFTPDGLRISNMHLITEISEADGLNNRYHSSKIKGHLTANVDSFRIPYDRNPVAMPRRFVYVGTTNSLEFISDEATARRFYIFHTGDKYIDIFPEEIERAYAQATRCLERGESYQLPPDKAQMQVALNMGYGITGTYFEEVAQFLRQAPPTFKIKDVREYLERIVFSSLHWSRQTKTSIENDLAILGCEPYRTESERGWRKTDKCSF